MIPPEKIQFLERFGDSDQQDLIEYIKFLWAEIEQLEHSQIKRENNLLRKSIAETNRNYVEVVNENLELKRKIEELDNGWWKTRWA